MKKERSFKEINCCQDFSDLLETNISAYRSIVRLM